LIISDTRYHYHFDGVGSVIALSDVNRVIVERYSYDVFGEPTIGDANAMIGVDISIDSIKPPCRRECGTKNIKYYLPLIDCGQVIQIFFDLLGTDAIRVQA